MRATLTACLCIGAVATHATPAGTSEAPSLQGSAHVADGILHVKAGEYEVKFYSGPEPVMRRKFKIR